MSYKEISFWCWKATRILLACLMAGTLLGILDSPIQRSIFDLTQAFEGQAKEVQDKLDYYLKGKRYDRDERPAESEQSLSEIKIDHVYKKTLTITASDDSIEAQYDIYLDKNEPLYQALQQTVARPLNERSNNARQIEIDVFGYVTINGRSLSFSQTVLEIEEVSSIGHVQLKSDSIPYKELYEEKLSVVPVKVFTGNRQLPLDVSEVIVKTENARVIPVNTLPRSQSWNRTYFVDVDKLERKTLLFDLVHPPPQVVTQEAKPISAVVSRVNEGYIPVLGSLLLGLLYGLPLLLFLNLRKYPELNSPIYNRFIDVTVLVLILYFGQAGLRALSDLVWNGPIWLTGSRPNDDLFGQPITGVGALIVLFPIFIWPGIVKTWERRVGNYRGLVLPDVISQARPPLTRLIGLLALSLWLITGFLVIKNYQADQSMMWTIIRHHGSSGSSAQVEFSPALPFLLAGLYFACLWITYEAYGNSKSIIRALLLAIGLLSFLPLDHLTFRYGFRYYFAVFISLPFMFAFARTVYPIWRGHTFKRYWKNLGLPARLLLIIGCLAVLFFLFHADESSRNTVSWWLITSMVWAVSRLWLFALLWMLVRFLRQLSDYADQSSLLPVTRDAGVVLALSFFFLPSQQWVYLPVAFLLGYILLKKWVFIANLPPRSAQAQDNYLQKALLDTLMLNDAERGLRSLKKEMLAKLGKGEIDYETYLDKITALENTVEERRIGLVKDSQPEGIAPLMFGPAISAWERGKRGALYGFLFAVPWIFLFLRNFRETPIPDINTELLSLITSGILSLAQWPLYGFFICYFYPHLRGSNGMQKGFNFFITIFIPLFTATVLSRPMTSDVWLAFILWGLQLFIQCMLLGLVAGDYETIRRAGFRWRHLIEVHDLGALAAWGSSVLVAIGAAITTLLTSGASSLITSGLKVLIPEIQLPQNH